MKRLIALVMLVAMVFCACSTEETPQSVNDKNSSQTKNTQKSVFEGSNKICLFENDACSMTLTKAEIDSLSDYCWDVTLVNRTESAQIFTMKRAYVNDFDFDPLWAVRVQAGETLETKIIWQSPDMQERGITQVTRVDFHLSVYEGDAPENSFADTNITVYPSSKSAHIAYLRSRVTTDIDIVDHDSYRFTIVAYDGDTRWGKELKIYAVNSTEKRVVFKLDHVTVNDQPCDPQWSYTLDSGKQGFSSIIWFDTALEELEITGTVQFKYDLLICDENGTVIERIPCTFVP